MRSATIAWVVFPAVLLAPAQPVADDKLKDEPPAASGEKTQPASIPDAAAAQPGDEPGASADSANPVDIEQAKARYLAGKASFEAGDFAAALAAFNDAYDLSRKPDLLFNLGVCAERLGQGDKAIEYYERYLAENPDAVDRDEVSRRLVVLKADSVDTEQAPLAGPLAEESATQEELVEIKREDKKVFWPAAVVGLGGLLLASGTLTAIMAHNKYGDLEDSCAPDCTDGKVAEVKRAAIAADVQFAVGGAIVITGVVLWLTSGDGESEGEVARIRGVPAAFQSGGGLVLEGEF